MATPTVVHRPVLSLAGSQTSPRATVPPTFRDPLPLGVRLYSIIDAATERWITRWVDDIQYRSVVPGGFASATITLRVPQNMSALPHPDPLGFSQLTELFRRIQIVDLRTMEIAWEGRIEDPARQVEPNTWQIGALGSMVAATDVHRPVFYIDSSLDNWVTSFDITKDGFLQDSTSLPPNWNWSTEKDDTKRFLKTNFTPGFIFNVSTDAGMNNAHYSWRWDSHGYDQAIARFVTTHNGLGSTGTATAAVIVGIAANWKVDNTSFSSGETTKFNVIGTDYTDTNTRYIVVGVTSNSGSYTVASGDLISVLIKNPMVLAMRQDRFGNKLTAAASYPGNYVTVGQVVEDVVGRFLVGGWYELGLNTPWPGSVRSSDVYIDTSATTQILHLAYPDGATAADILGDMITKVQTNAYWAIWESAWKVNDGGADPLSTAGLRFEYATWPNSFGYLATSQDGFEGQPNGDDIYNFVFYRFQDTDDGNVWHVSTTWTGGDKMVPEMNNGGFTRAITVNKQDPTSETSADTLANSYAASKNKVLNAGTLTVRRPIQFYDAGANSYSGGGRMLDPWMLRPGKLIRIADLPSRTGSTDLSFGTTLPSAGLDGTIFRVVATNYSSSDNSCRLELDQVARWQLPTQISSSPPKTIRIQ